MQRVLLLKFFFATLFSFLVSWYFIPLFIAVAYKFNIIDYPDGKLKRHKYSTPYLGGLAVFIGFLVSVALVFPFYNRLFLFLVGCSLLVLVGLVDDLIVLKPYQKFFGHMLTAFCFLRCGFYLKEIFFISPYSHFGLFVGLGISYFWILTVINAFNLIDIMDGLATTVALCVSVSYIILSFILRDYNTALLLFSLSGSLIAFWWFNKPRAKIYLGDSGSLFIGGVLASVPFMMPWGNVNAYGYLVPVVITAVPLLEVGTLVLIRFYRGVPFYNGSPDHFAQYLQQKGWSIWHILIYVAFCSLFLCFLSVAFCLNVFSIFSFVLLFFLFSLAWYGVLIY